MISAVGSRGGVAAAREGGRYRGERWEGEVGAKSGRRLLRRSRRDKRKLSSRERERAEEEAAGIRRTKRRRGEEEGTGGGAGAHQNGTANKGATAEDPRPGEGRETNKRAGEREGGMRGRREKSGRARRTGAEEATIKMKNDVLAVTSPRRSHLLRSTSPTPAREQTVAW